jgi:hypothetical protein
MKYMMNPLPGGITSEFSSWLISLCPNHFVLLLFLGLSLSCTYLFFESTMGLGEAICVYAVFMPISFRIQRVTVINRRICGKTRF